MASNPQIIADLKVIMEMDQNLELLSTYKGVPFVCKAKIENITDECVRVKTPNPSLICLKYEPLAKVLGSDYFEPAIAEVQSIDIPKGIIDMTDFSYIGAKLGERMIVRVEPKSPVRVNLETTDFITSGELADISISGIGLRIAQADYNSAFKPGVMVQIKMVIPPRDISVSGTILSAVKTDEYYRLSVRFAQDIPQRSLIFKYLIDRRLEIEKEVQEEYENYLKGVA
jgi:hypothetical protein